MSDCECALSGNACCNKHRGAISDGSDGWPARPDGFVTGKLVCGMAKDEEPGEMSSIGTPLKCDCTKCDCSMDNEIEEITKKKFEPGGVYYEEPKPWWKFW